jgi:hypothetical protein
VGLLRGLACSFSHIFCSCTSTAMHDEVISSPATGETDRLVRPMARRYHHVARRVLESVVAHDDQTLGGGYSWTPPRCVGATYFAQNVSLLRGTDPLLMCHSV